MKITKNKLKEIITEELSLYKFYDADKDWGGERYNTALYRSQLPLDSLDDLEDDHVELAVRDALHDADIDLEGFKNSETLVKGLTNAEAVAKTLGDDLGKWWQSWIDDEETIQGTE